MMRVLELRGCQKSTSWNEATLNSEEIKPIALVVIELCLSEGIGLSNSHSSYSTVVLYNYSKSP